MPALEKRASLDTSAFNAAVSLEVSQLAAAQLPDTLADLHQFDDDEDEALRTEQDLQSKFEKRQFLSLARLAGLTEDDDATIGAGTGSGAAGTGTDTGAVTVQSQRSTRFIVAQPRGASFTAAAQPPRGGSSTTAVRSALRQPRPSEESCFSSLGRG